MSSNRAEPRSIARQLVLLFTICSTLLLSCGLGVFYWIVVRHAFEEDNQVLADKVSQLQQDFEQHGADALSAEINAPGRVEERPFLVRILDPAGNVAGQTSGMAKLLPPDAFPPAAREIAVPTRYRSNGKLFALTTRSAIASGQLFSIQIAQNRTGDEKLAKEFAFLAAIVLAAGSLLAAGLAITVTRRGLRPLAKMRHSLECVQPARLNERIEPARWPAELRPLAASFDDMLERLEGSFTRLSQFSADLAHELRTPIGNMLGEAQVALTRDRSAKEYRSVVESTAAECERLSGIIDNLLFLARAESAEQQINRSTFDGRAALEKIANFYRTLAEEGHVNITCEGEAEVYADPILFNRAIGNLIDNALRFTPGGGNIRLSLRDVDRETEVFVSDTGSGIPPEHLPHVFDRFYRADPSRSSAGTGLGLSLVKSIVDLHGGKAAIQSQAATGAAVTLTFPKHLTAAGN